MRTGFGEGGGGGGEGGEGGGTEGLAVKACRRMGFTVRSPRMAPNKE